MYQIDVSKQDFFKEWILHELTQRCWFHFAEIEGEDVEVL